VLGEARLGIEGGVSWHDYEVVYGVEAEAHGVELSVTGRVEREMHCRFPLYQL
jgi:hypothetical protein